MKISSSNLNDGRSPLGPETIVFDSSGIMYTFEYDGQIVRYLPTVDSENDGNIDKMVREKQVYVGGRPLAGKFDSDQNLIVTVVMVGLCKINVRTKAIEILVNYVEDRPINFANYLDISRKDGKIYFTDSTHLLSRKSTEDGTQDLLPTVKLDFMEASKTGRILCYDPKTKKTSVLLKNLFFPNGILISSNIRSKNYENIDLKENAMGNFKFFEEDFILFAETFEFSIKCLYINGENKGKMSIIADDLPGFPDNISPSLKDPNSFYVAIPSLPTKFILNIRKYVQLRALLAKLPEYLKPKAQPYGLVIKMELQEPKKGEILKAKSISSIHDATGKQFAFIASVCEHFNARLSKQILYFGSFQNKYIGVLQI